MEPDSWIFSIGLMSGAVAFTSAAKLMEGRLHKWYKDRAYRRTRKQWLRLLGDANISDAHRAEIKLTLAELDLLRASGLKEKAIERERESAAQLSPDVADAGETLR